MLMTSKSLVVMFDALSNAGYCSFRQKPKYCGSSIRGRCTVNHVDFGIGWVVDEKPSNVDFDDRRENKTSDRKLSRIACEVSTDRQDDKREFSCLTNQFKRLRIRSLPTTATADQTDPIALCPTEHHIYSGPICRLYLMTSNLH